MHSLSCCLIWLLAVNLAPSAPLPGSPYDASVAPRPSHPIDQAVFGHLERQHLEPADLCSDAVFVRRAFLDTIGTLPTAAEARDFLLDRTPDKRRLLIDRLLERDEFADYWAMKWSDLLRIKAEFPINLWPNAAQAYHRWVRTSLRNKKPYDKFVRDLLTASGSNFRAPPVNFYRAMQSREPAAIAQAVALTFMGERTEKWPTDRLAGMAGFFAQVGYKPTAEWKEEIVFFDPATDTNGLARLARFPDGTPARLSPDQDPRKVFADWLIQPQNPWFTRNLVNRAWSWLLGRGIIHEPDDIQPDNPPANSQLLAVLEREFISSHYDFRHLFRLILNSQTYQLSSLPKTRSAEAEASFAYYPIRRLEAEVLIDALNQITTSTEQYSSAIPEPFTYIPEKERSISLPDGSITSSFLETFGRSARDTGLEAERNNRFTAAQALHLLNSSHVQRKIEQSQMIQHHTQGKKEAREAATGMYLGILSRFPTEAELQAVNNYAHSGTATLREAAVDLAWALLNSPEFLFRH
jgi:hypothetical protein